MRAFILLALACVVVVEAAHMRKANPNKVLDDAMVTYFRDTGQLGGAAPGCQYCPAVESPVAPLPNWFENNTNGFAMINNSETCFVNPVPLITEEPYISNPSVRTHCGCAQAVFGVSGAVSYEALSDLSCHYLRRFVCGFWWTATKRDAKTLDKFVAFEEPNIMIDLGHPKEQLRLINFRLNHSLSFTFVPETMGRMVMECGHCHAGFVEGLRNDRDPGTDNPFTVDAESYSNFTDFYDYDNATAGWNEANYQAAAGTIDNDVLHIRYRITGVYGCIVDPCFDATGRDKCYFANRYSCNIDSPLACGKCRCGYGPPETCEVLDEDLYACNTCNLDELDELDIDEMSVAEEDGTRLEVHGKTGDIYIGMATEDRTNWAIDHPNGWVDTVDPDRMVDPFRIRIRLGAIAEMEESYNRMDYMDVADADDYDGDDMNVTAKASKSHKIYGDGLPYAKMPPLKESTPHEWTCPLPYDWRAYPEHHSGKGKGDSMDADDGYYWAPDGWEDWAVDIMLDADGDMVPDMPVAKEACEWNVVGPALCRYPGTSCYAWTTTLDHDGLIFHGDTPYGSAQMQTWLFTEDCEITENGKTFNVYHGDVKFKTSVKEWPYCMPFVTGANDDAEMHVNFCLTDGADHDDQPGDGSDGDDCPSHAVGDYLEWSLDIYDNDGRVAYGGKGSKSSKGDWTRGTAYKGRKASKDGSDGDDWIACDWAENRTGAMYCHELGFGIEGMFCPQSIIGGDGVEVDRPNPSSYMWEHRMRQPYPIWAHDRHDRHDGDDMLFVFPAFDPLSTNNDTDEACDPVGAETERYVNHIYDSTIYTNAIHGGWSKWGHCEAKCKWDSSRDVHRSRTCTSPVPRFGGDDCVGPDTAVCTNLKMCPDAPPPGTLAIQFQFEVDEEASKGKSKGFHWSKEEKSDFIAALAEALNVNEVAFGPVRTDRDGMVFTYLQCDDTNSEIRDCTHPEGGVFNGDTYIAALEGVVFGGSLTSTDFEVQGVRITPDKSSGVPVGAIVGGVVGGMVLIAVVAAVMYKQGQGRGANKSSPAAAPSVQETQATSAALVGADDLMLSI